MITNYTNYVDFLTEEYNKRKENTCYFSYEFIASKIGLKSRSNVYRLFNGQRLLSAQVAIRLSKVLGLSHYETDYFVTLTLLANSTSEIEKEFLKTKLEKLRHEDKE